MNYTPITEENVEKAATLYMNHYNQHSGGEYQNKGHGRLLLQEVEQRVRERGAQMIELVCPDDAHHMHFYGGFGMAEATNLKLMKKRL